MNNVTYRKIGLFGAVGDDGSGQIYHDSGADVRFDYGSNFNFNNYYQKTIEWKKKYGLVCIERYKNFSGDYYDAFLVARFSDPKKAILWKLKYISDGEVVDNQK